MVEVVFNLCLFGLDSLNLLVGLLGIITSDADKLQVGQVDDIIQHHRLTQQLLEGFECLIHCLVRLLARGATLHHLIYLVLNKDSLQRAGMPLLGKLSQTNLQLSTQQPLSTLGTTTQNLAHTNKAGLLVADNTGIGRDTNLAIGKGIECINGLVGRLITRHLDYQLNILGCVIVNVANLNLTSLVCFDNRLLDTLGGCSEGYLADYQSTLVALGNLGTHLHSTTTQTIIISAHIRKTTCREVGIEFKTLAFQMSDCCIDKFIEVVRKNLRCKTHSNTLNTLSKQQRELNRQCNRLIITTIVREHPLSGLGVENNFHSKFGESRLNITGSSSTIACKDITPVTLTVNQQILLSELHKCIANRGISVGMEMHSITHNSRHLIITTILSLAHRVENTPLHGFQTILNMGHSTLQDNIRGIVQKPILVHTRQSLA